jgi:hypothetical protein
MVEIEKEFKYGYTKLTRFKVEEYNCKSDKRLGVVSKVFPFFFIVLHDSFI